jgi:uncharacterized protein
MNLRPANSSHDLEQLTARPGVSASLYQASRLRTRHAHWQFLDNGGQLFVVDGSQIFDVGREVIKHLDAAAAFGDAAVATALGDLGIYLPQLIDDKPLESPPLRALTLAVAQKCNLGCSYCYAGQGQFGGAPKNMARETARQAVELLVGSSMQGTRLNLAFLGGEPLANRAVLRDATEYAASIAKSRGAHISFSITTNGTLLTKDDAEFFERYGFAVTISLDGPRDVHNRQRPFRNGNGSFDRIIQRTRPLLEIQRKMQVSVRATVAPGNASLRETLDLFLGMNFHSVGFSPVLRSPGERDEISSKELANFLDAMVDCGLEFERRVNRGERYAFINITNALREIDRGTHRPYPCGAGAGYLGVSADGDLAACHRFVEDKDGRMGSLDLGIDHDAQRHWLTERHVHAQSPCHSCWARYLCSGGCHHEVIARGRPACDYIRGWLHFCLQVYSRLKRSRPDWFDFPASVPYESRELTTV